MAFSELIVHRALQPWRTAGLNLWLCEDQAHAEAVRHPAAVAAPVPVPVPALPAVPTSSSARPTGATDSRRPGSPTTSPNRPVPPVASVAPTAPATQVAPTIPVQDAELLACIRPVAAWPEPWQALLNRSPQAAGARRARIVWSYPALRDDYGGRADPARRAMLQQLLRDLALPSGSHAFWPQTPPPYETAESATAADPAFFHSGIEALNPLVVVLFGAPSAELRLPSLVHLVPEMVLGRTFVRVQDVDVLAAPFASGKAGSSHLPHQGLVQFLKSQFSALFIS